MSKKFYLATFGCRTNQADSAAIRDDFLQHRFKETQTSTQADMIVVNSCTVTHRSDQQVRQMVRRLRRENPQARLVVTGCYAQRDPAALAAIPGVDAVVGNTHKHDLVPLSHRLNQPRPAGKGELTAILRDDFQRIRRFDIGSAHQVGGRTRPFVKIQDGCDSKCSYCIIPAVRGPSRSAPAEQIVRQVEHLVQQGFQEIVLTGIHIGTYGLHIRPRVRLDQLLQSLLEIRRLGRLRISSIEPMEFSRKVIALAVGSQGRIAPHFHICLQSGCDRTLRRMRRPYSRRRFASIVGEVHRLLPEAGIGTDVISGFPGESERDHAESLQFVKSMPLSYLHVFPYSDRRGTAASQLPEKVDPGEIRQRALQFRQLSEEKNTAFRRRSRGRKLTVLTLDDVKQGRRIALSGNYLKAQLDPAIPPNQLLRLRVTGESNGYLNLEFPTQASKTTTATA